MSSSISGFLAPSSISGSYVLNKRNQDGSFKYDSLLNKIGIEKQGAIQQLNKQYESVINNAYNSYLSANRGVLGSNMGQGYKEAYLENQRKALANQITEANLSSESAKQQINQQVAEARNEVYESYLQETGNFDRMYSELAKYRDYLGTLSNESGYYLDDYSKEASIDLLYNKLFEQDPKAYTDADGISGKSFFEWLIGNRTDSADDNLWYDWLLNQGGFNEYKEQAKKKWETKSKEQLQQVINDAMNIANMLGGKK